MDPTDDAFTDLQIVLAEQIGMHAIHLREHRS